MPKAQTRKRKQHLPVPVEVIGSRIYLVRGHKVTVDSHLAKLYRWGPAMPFTSS